jgi:hypothetical protein
MEGALSYPQVAGGVSTSNPPPWQGYISLFVNGLPGISREKASYKDYY